MMNNISAHRHDLFEYPCKNFRQHLQVKNNSRILFSGKFGIGKTYFLQYFFNAAKEQAGDKIQYNAFHIYPVNYSIASNEDIFRYIKYDIVSSFLKLGVQV